MITEEHRLAMEKAKLDFLVKPNTAFLGSILFSLEIRWNTEIETARINPEVVEFNPDFFLIDIDTQVVYRKESFIENDGQVSEEFIIRDRRYKRKDIISLLESEGLTVLKSSYVQAGRWSISLESTDSKAKEILLFVTK